MTKRTILNLGGLIVSSQEVVMGKSHLIIENSVITGSGAGHLYAQTADDEILWRPRSVAMAGFVNAHGHASMTLLRGAGDDVPLMTWLNERVYPLEDKLTGEAVYWGTMLACWEMLSSGTTTFTDMYFHMHDAARAVEDSGIRGVLSWGVVGLNESGHQNGLRNSREFASWHGKAEGRITVTLGPHAPYTCPPETLRAVTDLSFELDVPIQIHLSETLQEVSDSMNTHGKSPIAHARDCGLFGRPVLAAHCVHVSEEDIEILHTHDVKVAHNPQSNLKLASGIAPIVQMRAAGVTVGLGTDGAASNNNLDMFEEMRLAATLHKGVQLNSTVIPASEALQMATEDSAKCVFLSQDHGTLCVGAKADVTLLDLDSPHFLPTYDLVSNVVYAAGADDVTDVFVSGRQLLRNRQPVTIDVERVRYEVRRIESELRTLLP